MGYLIVSPDDRAELAAAYARATGTPDPAATLLGDAARDEALGMSGSATALRELADLTRALPTP